METKDSEVQNTAEGQAGRSERDHALPKGLRGKAYRVAREHPLPRRDSGRFACVGADPTLFDPKTESELRRAQSYCLRCPSLFSCRFGALERQEWGVWGGLLLDQGKVIERPKQQRSISRKSREAVEALAG